jgi:hypothetical protein
LANGLVNGRSPKAFLVFQGFVGIAFDEHIAHVQVGGGDALDTQWGGEFCPDLTPAVVQGQGIKLHAFDRLQAFDQLHGVGHLRTPLGVDKGANHHSLKPRIDHHVQELDFFLEGDTFSLNLEAVSQSLVGDQYLGIVTHGVVVQSN